KRLHGIHVRMSTPEEAKDPDASIGGGRDRVAFPEFYAQYDEASGLNRRLGRRVIVNAPISYIGRPQLDRDIANLQAALAKTHAVAGFLPVVAPASALPGAKNEHYPDERSFLSALADALHEEYRTIVEAGLYVQIDDAFLPYMYEKMVPPRSLAEYKAWAQVR